MFKKILKRHKNVSSTRNDNSQAQPRRKYWSRKGRGRRAQGDPQASLVPRQRTTGSELRNEDDEPTSRLSSVPPNNDTDSRSPAKQEYRRDGTSVTRAPVSLSSPTSFPNVTTSASTTSETDEEHSSSTTRPSRPCFTFCTSPSSVAPSSTSICFRHPCRPTMDPDPSVSVTSSTISTTSITSAETITLSPSTITLTDGDPSTASGTSTSTITLTLTSTPTPTTSNSVTASTSSGPKETDLPIPTETQGDTPAFPSPPSSTPSTSEPPLPTRAPPTQTESDPTTAAPLTTLSTSPLPTASTTSIKLEPLPNTSSNEFPEETSTTTTTFIPAPTPATRPITQAASTQTRTVIQPTFSTFTFTSVVTSTFTDGTTTFTSVVETGVLATDAPSDNAGFAMNIPGIIGVSIGSAVFLILLVLSLFFCARRIRSRRTPSNSSTDSSTSVGNSNNGVWSPPLMDDDEKHLRLISSRVRGLYGAAAAAFSHLNLTAGRHAGEGSGSRDEERGFKRDSTTKSGVGSEESTAVEHMSAESGPVLAPPSYGYASTSASNSDAKNEADVLGDATTPRSLDSAGGGEVPGGDDHVLGDSVSASLRKHHSLYGLRPCPGSTRSPQRHRSTPTSLTQHLLSVQAQHATHSELVGASEFGEIPLSQEMRRGSQNGSPWYHLSSNGRRTGDGIPNPFGTASSSSESVKGMVDIPVIPMNPSYAATASPRPPSSLLNPPHPTTHTSIALNTTAGPLRTILPPILPFPRSVTGNSYTATSSKNPFANPPLTPPSPALTQRTLTDDGASFMKEGLLHPALLGNIGTASPGIEQADSVASLRDHMDYSRPISSSGLMNIVAREDSLNSLGSVGDAEQQLERSKT